VRVIKEVVTQFKESAVSAGLEIKESKAKYLKINNYNKFRQDLIMNG